MIHHHRARNPTLMANHFSSGVQFPQNQNSELNEEVPILIDDVDVDEDEDDSEEEDESEEEEDEREEEYADFVEELENGSEAERDKRRITEAEEACSLSGEGSQGNDWNRSDIDGLFCPICMEAWSNDGDHHIWCEPFSFFFFFFQAKVIFA